MKITTSATLSWFWESKSFKEGKRLLDYTVLLTVTLLSNKISASMLRTDTDISLISNNKHLIERIGYNIQYTNYGGLTNYLDSKLAVFTDLGYNGSNLTDEQFWTYTPRLEKIQWLNGETLLGYNGGEIMSNLSKANKLRQIISNAINTYLNTKISIYSWLDITGGAIWYNTDVNALMNLYNNLYLIYSAQIDAGCNSVMDAIYSTNDNLYDSTALHIFKKQLLKLKYGNTILLYSLMWTENETVDDFLLLHTVKRKRQDNIFINLSGAKHNANAEYVYNAALISLTISDGIIGWEGVMLNVSTEKLEFENTGWDVGGSLNQFQVGTETWTKDMARVWKSCRLYWDLAINHVSQHKSIIESTINDWFTLDFKYNNIMRTGSQKLILYNKLYKELVVQLKYNDNKTECLVLVHNPWAANLQTKIVTVFDNTTGLEASLLVKGTKAELYKIEL